MSEYSGLWNNGTPYESSAEKRNENLQTFWSEVLREDRSSEVLRLYREDLAARGGAVSDPSPGIARPSDLESYRQDRLFYDKHAPEAENVRAEIHGQGSFEDLWGKSGGARPTEANKDAELGR